MNKLLATAVLTFTLASGVATAAAAGGDVQSWPMMSMMGGSCPMMSGAGMMGGGMMGGGMMGGGMMSGHQNQAVTAIDNRLAYLKAQLKITDAQMPAWSAYVDAVRARFAAMQTAHQQMFDAMRNGGTLARMDARIAAMGTMLDAMKALRPATGALYAALTADQKPVADRLIGAGCGMM